MTILGIQCFGVGKNWHGGKINKQVSSFEKGKWQLQLKHGDLGGGVVDRRSFVCQTVYIHRKYSVFAVKYEGSPDKIKELQAS